MISPIEALIDTHCVCSTCKKSWKDCKCLRVRKCQFRDCNENAIYEAVVPDLELVTCDIVCCEKHSKEPDIDPASLCLL